MDEVRSPAGIDPRQLLPLCSLDDPTRLQLYEYVAASAAPVTRDEASAALNLERSLVAYHLDRLVDEGLLAVTFARRSGRTGPGAGRPAKHYRRADREFSVSVPARNYRLLADLLADAITADSSGTVRDALQRAAADQGRALAADGRAEVGDVDSLVEHLADLGFEPATDEGTLRLRNCPFHQLAREHTELVCGMNLAMLTGLADALGADVRPRLDPAPGRCCVAFRISKETGES